MTPDIIALSGGTTPLVIALAVGALGTVPLHLMRRQRKPSIPAEDVAKALHQLTYAIEKLQAAKSGIVDAMEDSLARVDRGFEEIERKRVQVEDLADLLEGQSIYHQKRCDEAIKLSEAAVTPLLKRAETEIRTLRKVVELARETRGEPAEATPPPKVHDLMARAGYVPETATDRPILTNPFLKVMGER